MKHIRIRYTIERDTPFSRYHTDLCYAVADHQKGGYVARGLTLNSAHNLIDKLTGLDTSPDMPVEFPAHDRAASRADELYDRNREGW